MGTPIDDGECVYDLSWFEEFVPVVVAGWAKLQKEAARRNPTRKQIGDEGEDHVRDRMMALGYEAVTTPASRSPADVWGLQDVKGVLHLPLIQVKTSLEGVPATLTARDSDDLEALASHVFDRFKDKRNKTVPRELESFPLIVSCGYAGVTLAEDPDEAPTWEGKHISHFFESTLDEKQVSRFVKGFYKKF
jgi:hypothetical protein